MLKERKGVVSSGKRRCRQRLWLMEIVWQVVMVLPLDSPALMMKEGNPTWLFVYEKNEKIGPRQVLTLCTPILLVHLYVWFWPFCCFFNLWFGYVLFSILHSSYLFIPHPICFVCLIFGHVLYSLHTNRCTFMFATNTSNYLLFLHLYMFHFPFWAFFYFIL